MIARFRGLLAILAILATTQASYAYYHFVHYSSRNAPFRPQLEKFDASALPGQTVTYFINEPNGVRLASTDSMQGLISQIRAAAKVWNDVETSELRVAYGGLTSPGAQSKAPAPIEVVFDELPPGVIAQAAPAVRAQFNGSFVPIQRSVITLPLNLTNRLTYSEALFGTLVHEFGHALGLQHSITSSVMSTSSTRATSRSKPLASDDITAISLLYPTQNFLRNTGSITGRVTFNGSGQSVNMASVVAVAQGFGAISTLTNPDGTYRLEGLPARQYLLYVHPLPPALEGESNPAGINPPVDSEGRSFPASGAFDTIFYPNTKDSSAAFPIAVAAGSNRESVDFSVSPRSAPTIHTVQSYAYPGETYAKPPYLFPTIARPYIVAAGYGVWRNGGPVPGLRVNLLGGQALTVSNFSDFYVRVDVPPSSLLFGDGPRHLVFSAANDIYVLPAAFHVAQSPPPFISSVTPGVDLNGQKIATITGTQLSAQSMILFEGLQAPVRSFEDASGRLTVTVPPAPAGLKANVVALNPDGQSSLFLQENSVPTYTYDGASEALATLSASSGITASPSSIPAGTEAMIQIDGLGTSFVDGQVSVGFGTPDVVAKRAFVVGPNRLLVWVAISPSAQPGTAFLNVTSGLNVLTAPLGFSVASSNPRQLWISSSISNITTGGSTLTPNALAALTLNGLQSALTPGSVTLTLNDQQVPVLAAVNNQVSFQLPAGFPTGPVVIRVDIGGQSSLPIVIPFDAPNP